MDFLIVTLGSHGDVHPFTGVAKALQTRGHTVRLAANEAFGEMIGKAGIPFVQLGTSELFEKWTSNPDIWHPTKGSKIVFDGIASVMRDVYELTRDQANPDTCVIGSSLALGALIASEKHNLKYATAHLSPICVRSYKVMPNIDAPIDLNRLPMFARRAFWWIADKIMIDRLLCPSVNTLRKELGLKPVTRLLDQWWNSSRLTLGLWPDWYFPKPSDYPSQVQLTGFPMYDESDHQILDPDLQKWLESGDPPIAFTPGSAMRFGEAFFKCATQTCNQMNRRGILLSRHPAHIPKNLPDNVKHIPFAPFSQLLPYCCALIHHGGIGTTAQALRAGIPQLIMPMSHDQPDNANICKKLGVADSIKRNQFTPNRIITKLNQLFTNPQTRLSCEKISDQFKHDHGLDKTVAALEKM